MALPTGKRVDQFNLTATQINDDDYFGISQDIGGGIFHTKKAKRSLLMSADEQEYWIIQAALLDPRAYDFIEGAVVVVPAGVKWSVVAMWGMQDSGGNPSQYQRVADSNKPISVAPGTTFTNAFAFSHVYICKPELVTGVDPRYASGLLAKNLYFQRKQRLFTLPIFNLTVDVPNTTPFGTVVDSAFPVDFDYGLVAEVSSFDVSWVGLLSVGGAGGTMNLDQEVSDDHQSRFTNVTSTPFSRTIFPSIRSRPSTISGGTGTTLGGFGNVWYYKLPADW